MDGCIRVYKKINNGRTEKNMVRFSEYSKKEQRARSRKYFFKRREKLYNILGHKCVRCGFSDKRALQFDHINGGGTKDIKKNGLYQKLTPQEIKAKYQVLCANCNWIKRAENKETRKRID